MCSHLTKYIALNDRSLFLGMWFAASSINVAAALRLVVTGVTVTFRPWGSGHRARSDLFVLEPKSPVAHYVTGLVFFNQFYVFILWGLFASLCKRFKLWDEKEEWRVKRSCWVLWHHQQQQQQHTTDNEPSKHGLFLAIICHNLMRPPFEIVKVGDIRELCVALAFVPWATGRGSVRMGCTGTELCVIW